MSDTGLEVNLDQKSATPPKESLFGYNSPVDQVGLIGLVCFCCPGMYNALSGIDPTAVNNANTALYATFAIFGSKSGTDPSRNRSSLIFGILGGGIYNVLGPCLTLASGCSTYALYAGSFFYYNHYHHQTLAIITGVILGIGAGFLRAGKGAIMTSYPPHDRMGTYISLFWSIFSMGGVIGGLIPFMMNFNRSEAGSVNDATYIGCMCFMTVGALLSLAILPPNKVIRDDGTSCTKVEYSSVLTEANEIVKLFLNRKMLLIVPVAWAGNFFCSCQFNNANAALFNLRTRGLNNVLYWVAQILGSIGISYVLDFSFSSRKTRGYVGIGIVAWLWTAIWGGGLASQLKYSRHDMPEKLDFKDSGSDYAGLFVLYLSYGLMVAMFQTLVYWLIGCLANDSETLSRYTGFYKGVQSAGAAVAWQIDTRKVPFLSELIVNWSLTTVCYPLLLVLVKLAVKDDKEDEEGAEREVASSFAQ